MTSHSSQAEVNREFNLQDRINHWDLKLQSEPSVTASDAQELMGHLLDLIDELKKAGLDEEEAFWVASKRMGSNLEWKADFEEVNKPVLQMRRSLLILAGVLAYFLILLFTILIFGVTDTILQSVSKNLMGQDKLI